MSLSARAQAAIAVALYALFALALTWPMPANLASEVYGGGGDAWAEIAIWRELAEGPMLPFLPGTVNDFAAPEGQDYAYALYVATWPSTGSKWLLALVFGPVAGWNLFVLAGYVLSGIATFLLARKLTGSWLAALVAGWAFAFWPFAAENGKSHVDFAHGWVFVLLAWRMLELRDRPTVRNGLLAGAASIVCLSFNPYFLLFGAVAYGVFALAGLLARSAAPLAERVKGQAVSAGVLGVAVAIYGAVNATAPTSTSRSYGLEQLVTYGARPLQYLVPHPDTLVFGSETADWWANNTQGGGVVEKGLYLGITVVLLAAAAVAFAALRRVDVRERANTWVFAALAVVAAAFSAPPYFQPGGITLYMPSYFVFEVYPTWRVFSRFGVVVMFAVAMLAAFGLARLMRGRSPRGALAVFAVAALVVFVDLWARPETPTQPIPNPPAYAFLEGEPKGILAEYPVTPNTLPEYGWALNQDIHDRPILNGWAANSREEARALWMWDLGEPATAGELAALGVSDVMLIDNYAPPGVRVPEPPGEGFRLVGRAEGRSVWRVVAEPAESMAWVSQGGGEVVEGDADNEYMWLEQAEGEITVTAECDPCEGTLYFRAASKTRERRLRLLDPSGRTLLDETVPPTDARDFTARLSFSRQTRLKLLISPGPEPAGGGDVRDISILVSEPAFEETR